MAKIYESPDGGRTVYERDIGSIDRELVETVKKDARTWDGKSLHKHLLEDKMWGEIRRMATIDDGLKDLLDRAIVYYNLKKDHVR